MLNVKRNERDWAGQLISWIKAAIERKTVIFEDATNDTSVKMESGQTKFPDVLLFVNRISGIIFNGWELKFPDTPIDDPIMLENALEKAKKLNSNSFVTWNGGETIIWKIDTANYNIESLSRLKVYPKIKSITKRDDLADPTKYTRNEIFLKNRLEELLHDLDRLCRDGELKPAINISGNIIQAVKEAAVIIIPQFEKAIYDRKGVDSSFRQEFSKWRIYESATLQILETSSKYQEKVVPENILAKFTFYNLIGKILFYMTLCENMSGELSPIKISTSENIQQSINQYFDNAKHIDYQAIFKPYFTDVLEYSRITEVAIYKLLSILSEFDFKILPNEVIGYILENLVPDNEKQKFGQYFTPSILANLVAYPAVKTKNDILFDPTCGTGTFLTSFYNILNYFGETKHSALLNQIWGNDVSHFPAILSVINLYKQNVSEIVNFPRIMRDDFFNLSVGSSVVFPDSQDFHKHINVRLPQFDGIASNLPFIQQEDIPNVNLIPHLKKIFGETQTAFMKDCNFNINERSDYFTYCVYNALHFLKDDGIMSVITSNAWLTKEYGLQFKKFLLNNFHIKYIVKSVAEHWFKDSSVSTIFFVVEKKQSNEPTRFVTLNKKLTDLFSGDSINTQITHIDEFYAEIDNCEQPYNNNWKQNKMFSDLYCKNDESVYVSIIPRTILLQSLNTTENWDTYFISSNIFSHFNHLLTVYNHKVFEVLRGERTGWNNMFVIKKRNVPSSRIASQYLIPYIKSSNELKSIAYDEESSFYLFTCNKAIEELDDGTKDWIKKFKDLPNKNGKTTISEACNNHHPFWYTLNPKRAHIITSINPYKRIFFTYSKEGFTIDQRLIAMVVNDSYDIDLIAALLNSVVSYLTLEFKGIGRYLGVLDLNADFLKKICFLNPDLLSSKQKDRIKKAFSIIRNREIGDIEEECKMADRIKFDEEVLSCFGIKKNILPSLYELLCSSVKNRSTMAKK